MSNQTTNVNNLTSGKILGIIGVSLVLAPFTGGGSIAYGLTTLGCAAAVDAATQDQSATN